MVCVRWSLALLLTCVYGSFAQIGPCDVYNEDFQCDEIVTVTQIPLVRSLKPQKYIDDGPLPNCETNPTETTLHLMAEMTLAVDTEFLKLNKNNEAIMVIGSTGTGKSTLSYFVAGNDSSLIAYNKNGGYYIMDCNGKIGDPSVILETVFPEVVVDPDTSVALLDYPGFYKTRPVCSEIAHAYSMINAAQRLKRAKVIITVEYYAVTAGSKGSFLNTIKSVINFIPGIETLGQGIGLVVTKVDRPGDTNAEVVSNIIDFLIDVLSDPNFSQNFIDPGNGRKAAFIINMLLNKSKIGIFRVPDNCGPLSTIPVMIENKLMLKYVTFINVSFVATQPSDFSYELSSDALQLVTQIQSYLTQEITSSLTTIALKVSSFLNYDCLTYSQCNETLAVIDKLIADSEFTKGYLNFNSWANEKITKIVNATTDVYFNLPGVVFSSSVSKLIHTSAAYLTSLESIDNFRINLETLHKPLQMLHSTIMTSAVFLKQMR